MGGRTYLRNTRVFTRTGNKYFVQRGCCNLFTFFLGGEVGRVHLGNVKGAHYPSDHAVSVSTTNRTIRFVTLFGRF